MHNHTIDRVLGYVAKGLGVRIVGAPGSGKSTLVRSLVARLEEDGVEVFTMFGTPALAAVPFAGVLSLGLDFNSRTIGILGVSDYLSAQFARTGARVMVIDDVGNLDRESLAVVNILRSRANVPLVITVNDNPLHPTAPAGLLACLPEASVALPALGFGQINKLIAKILGAPAEVDVAAHVLTKSGGNLRLAVRLVESSVLSGGLLLKNGRWSMPGAGLMNEHLYGALEALLQGLRTHQLRALHKMSLLGPTPVSQLVATVGEDALDDLEVGGLISVVSGPDGTPVATVFPPLLDDYLAARAVGSRRVLQSTLTGRVGSHALAEAPTNRLPAAVAAIRAEMNGNHAATNRYFQQRSEAMERDHFSAWEHQRNLANAVPLLACYWGAPVDPERVQEVFSRTDMESGTAGELFFFTMTQAWWMYTARGDLKGGVALLRTTASREPRLRPEAEAFISFLEASCAADGKVTIPDPEPGLPGGAFAIIKGILELYSLKPGAALTSIAAGDMPDELQRFETFIRGLALFASGRVEESLILALASRQKAMQEIDQFTLVSQSYLAALSLQNYGLFDEAEYLMGRSFSFGTPSPLLNSLHDAMLRLSSLRAGDGGGTEGTPAKAPDVGPLPGVGTGLLDLAASRPVSAKSFDQLASRLVSKALARGFVFEAVHTGIFALGLLPGPRVRDLLKGILRERGLAVHDQLLAAADAAIEGDVVRLRHVLDTYVPDADTYHICMVLRGAAQRWQLSGEPDISRELARAAKDFSARFRPTGALFDFCSEAPGSSLTVREIEVAMVAGQQSNQDIAEHLGISIRTVESHISNALRKTDSTTRKQLADLVQGMPEESRVGAVGGFPDQETNRLNAVLEG
ncbi:LuxR C-terminal-related transcriptional regulator [Paenarthrobacter sp. NPDC018779]|uniref:LuxR C-terminal-related transcriptional regulator n=1 Tax=Paenarthrobacter sp. NPDC018779 TaxID=3364375 RepID=UPI0037C80FCA